MKKGLLLFYLALSALALADDVTLGKSVISPDYIEVEKLKSTKNVIVIDEKDIAEKGYQNVSEILDDVPGITVGTSGWGEIDIRGQGKGQAAKNVQVMIDGTPISALTNHPIQMDSNLIPVEQIEKIEIIPGGGSIIYGGGTSGGVVNITTNLKSMTKPKNKVGYEFTINQEKKHYINIGEKINDNLTFQLNYSKSEKDWYFKDTYNNLEYFSGGLNYKINNNQGITLKFETFNRHGQFIKNIKTSNLKKYGKNATPSITPNATLYLNKYGEAVRGPKLKYLNTDGNYNKYSIDYNNHFNKNISLFLNYFKQIGTFSNTKEIGFQRDPSGNLNQNIEGIQGKLNINYLNNNSLLIGITNSIQKSNLAYSDLVSKRIKPKYGKPDIPDISKGEYANGNYIYNKYGTEKTPIKKIINNNFYYEKQNLAFYLLNNNKFNDFEFNQGIRYDITKWKWDKNGSKLIGSGNDTRYNQNYSISAGYNYRDTGKIYTSYEKTFTGPDGIEITDIKYSRPYKIYSLTTAKDQITDLYEIGFRDFLFNSAINFDIFYNFTKGELSRDKKSYNTYYTLNKYNTKRWGAELSLRQVFEKFSFEENYTYLMGKSQLTHQGKIMKKNEKLSDSGLQKVPKHNLFLKANYNFTDNLTTGLTWKYTGSYNNFADEKNNNKDNLVKSNTVVDFSLRYNNPNGISVYGGINNLFNEEYFGYVGDSFGTVVPQQGRSFFAGFSYTF